MPGQATTAMQQHGIETGNDPSDQHSDVSHAHQLQTLDHMDRDDVYDHHQLQQLGMQVPGEQRVSCKFRTDCNTLHIDVVPLTASCCPSASSSCLIEEEPSVLREVESWGLFGGALSLTKTADTALSNSSNRKSTSRGSSTSQTPTRQSRSNAASLLDVRPRLGKSRRSDE